MTHAELKILPLFGKTLDSRDEACRLFDHLKEYCQNCGNLELDFAQVDFMSRSFADEFHKQKMDWIKKANVIILIKNASNQIIDILRAVAKTQTGKVYKTSDTPVYSYSKNEQLLAFLNAI